MNAQDIDVYYFLKAAFTFTTPAGTRSSTSPTAITGRMSSGRGPAR